MALAREQWSKFASTALDRIAAYHAENPDLQGMGREELRMALQPRLLKPAFDAALQKLARANELVLEGAFVRLRSHEMSLTAEDMAAWEAVAPLLGGTERFRPPRVRDIATATGRPEADVRRILKLAGRMGWADEVAHDHFFLRSTVREMVGIAADLIAAPGHVGFSAAEFRDRVANGRKVAIQILEFFDRRGVTLRSGDLRRINPRPPGSVWRWRAKLMTMRLEENRPRWGVRTSNPCGAASLSQVGSTPTLFRQSLLSNDAYAGSPAVGPSRRSRRVDRLLGCARGSRGAA